MTIKVKKSTVMEELQEELKRHKEALKQTRTAVKRLLLAQGRNISEDWYRKTASRCGLVITPTGLFQEVDDEIREPEESDD